MPQGVDSPFSWSLWSLLTSWTKCALILKPSASPLALYSKYFKAGSVVHLLYIMRHVGMFHGNRLPPDLYAPAFDLRGISTVEDLAWATGMTVEEVTGGKDAELTILSNDMLQDMKVATSRTVPSICTAELVAKPLHQTESNVPLLALQILAC
jgi:hypothetical protein